MKRMPFNCYDLQKNDFSKKRFRFVIQKKKSRLFMVQRRERSANAWIGRIQCQKNETFVTFQKYFFCNHINNILYKLIIRIEEDLIKKEI